MRFLFLINELIKCALSLFFRFGTTAQTPCQQVNDRIKVTGHIDISVFNKHLSSLTHPFRPVSVYRALSRECRALVNLLSEPLISSSGT